MTTNGIVTNEAPIEQNKVLKMSEKKMSTKDIICQSFLFKDLPIVKKNLKLNNNCLFINIRSDITLDLKLDDIYAIEIILIPGDQTDKSLNEEENPETSENNLSKKLDELCQEKKQETVAVPVPNPLEMKFKYRQKPDETFVLESKSSLKEVMNHLFKVLNCEIGWITLWDGCERWTVESLKEALVGCNPTELQLNIFDNKPYTRQFLKQFLPVKGLILGKNPYDADWEFRKHILKYPMDRFFACGSLDFDNVLLEMDIRQIDFRRAFVSILPVLNYFFKKWIEGETNENLEFLCVQLKVDTLSSCYQTIILNGIEYEEVLEEEKYTPLDMNLLWAMVDSVIAMYDIKRKTDGKRATIKFDRFKQLIRFKFIVRK